MVELFVSLEQLWKNGDYKIKKSLLSIILVELFIDNKKQLHIQEKKLFEYIKVLNGVNGRLGVSNGRTKEFTQLYYYFLKSPEVKEIYEEIKSL